MDKAIIRSKYLDLRDNINNRLEKEKKINNLLISLNISSKKIVSGYFPVRGEVNILPFIDFITDNKNIVCMPFIKKKIIIYCSKAGKKVKKFSRINLKFPHHFTEGL